MDTPSHQRGFVALLSVVIISAALLAIIFTLNLSSYFMRFDVIAHENKRISLGLAEACVEAAKLKIAQDVLYVPAPGGDEIEVNDLYVCRICSVSGHGSSIYTIATRSKVNGSYSNIAVTAKIVSGVFNVQQWNENSRYSGQDCILP